MSYNYYKIEPPNIDWYAPSREGGSLDGMIRKALREGDETNTIIRKRTERWWNQKKKKRKKVITQVVNENDLKE